MPGASGAGGHQLWVATIAARQRTDGSAAGGGVGRESMTTEDARQRIQSAIDQFGGQAGMAIDLVINEVRSSLGNETANDLIDEFDLELQYNIAPTEPEGSGD